MSTNGWMGTHSGDHSPSSSQQQEPRRSAPPIMQQTVVQAQEEVVWDDTMMDLDYFHEKMPVEHPDPAPEFAIQELRPVDIGSYPIFPLTDAHRPVATTPRGYPYTGSRQSLH